MKPLPIKIGDEFDRLIVIGLDLSNGIRKWKCLCDCGNIIVSKADALVRGATKSCGCLRKDLFVQRNTKHGAYKTPEYKIWENMITRCENRNSPYYKHYGGRGIEVCKEWRHSFETFMEDMGERPTLKHELDRYPDNNGNYEPSNCRWATRKQQLNNKRDNFLLTVGNITKTVTEWAEISGVNRKTITCRVKVGSRSIEDCIFDPPLKRKNNVNR